ncbi:MAG: serine/threonine protein kinase [Solirubrobacteraceae bacterium]|nr:serine/threonine protein kinase [Solirubrobacteraceae bacterium]
MSLTPPNPAMSVTHIPGVGDVLGGCRLERLAGRGGMGVVYEATQLALGRRVAVKVISPALAHDSEFRERFSREARLAASLHHPGIVDVHDAGEQDGVLYLVMRYVEGTDLRSVLREEQRLPERRAVRIAAQVASALDAAHAAGIVHRDVTPSNVLLSGEGAGERALLTDFGLVKHLETTGATRSGQWLGTAAFVSPEALRGEPLDGRADVYALGCVLHRMLTGEVPFPRESDAATIAAHLHDPAPSPSRLVDVDPAFDDVVARALAKEPGERFASAGELAAAAQAALDGHATAAEAEAAGSLARTPVAPATTESTRRMTPAAQPPVNSSPGARRRPRSDAPRTAPPWLARGSSRRASLIVLASLLALAVAASAGAALDRVLRDDASPRRSVRRAIPRVPAPVTLTSYATAAYAAQVPAGWRPVADDVDRGDFNESRWRAPEPSRAELVIAYRAGSTASPGGIAEAARGRQAADPTYSELAFGPIELGGAEAYRWAYGIAGQARVSWYLNRCATSIAVYGATRPAEILRWMPTYRAVAASLEPVCP